MDDFRRIYTKEELFGNQTGHIIKGAGSLIYLCQRCGALTAGPDIHVVWHNTLDKE